MTAMSASSIRLCIAVETPLHAGLDSLLSYRSERPLSRRDAGSRASRQARGHRHRLVSRPADDRRTKPSRRRRGLRRDRALLAGLARSGRVRGVVLPARDRRDRPVGAAGRVAAPGQCRLWRSDGLARKKLAAAPSPEAVAASRRRSCRREQAAGDCERLGAAFAAAPARHRASARQHRQRQDRGLPARHRRRARARGGRRSSWCRRSTSRRNSIARFAERVRRPHHRLAAQRPDAGATPAPLAAGARRHGRHRPRDAPGGVRIAAAASA